MHDQKLVLNEKLEIFGELLANQRKKKGVKQKELADLCGISQRAQSSYERGEVAPKVDYLFKLQALGYDIHKLIATSTSDTYELDNREQTIIDLYRQSPIEVQLSVLELLAAQAVNPNNSTIQKNEAFIAGQQTNNNIKIKK